MLTDFPLHQLPPVEYLASDQSPAFGPHAPSHRINFYAIVWFLEDGGQHYIDFEALPIRKNRVSLIGKSQVHSAKHGVIGLTETAAIEYAAKGVRVNAVGPGFIKTPLVESSMSQEAKDALVALHPIGRLGESSEVAELVLWLSSDKASFVTGSYYNVDGGYLAR